MPLKNKPVSGHAVDVLLDCTHVKQERVESAVTVPQPGEARYCETCKATRIISKVGSMYWLDENEQ